MSDLQLRLLLVGAGHRTRTKILPALAVANIGHVAAIYDPAPDLHIHVQEAAVAGLLPADVRVYPDLQAALTFGSYDAAIVACPHDEHQTSTLQLAAAGIPVWKEKPFALTVEDARELAAHTSTGLRVLAHRPHGFLYQEAADRLARWGRLLSYRMRITRQTSDYSATWRASQARAGGGAIVDLGYHAADLVVRFAGMPQTVYATVAGSPAHRSPVEVEETAHLALTHADGCTGSVYLSRCADDADELELVAERGRINIRNQRGRFIINAPGGLGTTVELDVTHDDPVAHMLRYHANTMADPDVTAFEVGVGVSATTILQAAYDSLASGQPANLTPALLEGATA